MSEVYLSLLLLWGGLGLDREMVLIVGITAWMLWVVKLASQGLKVSRTFWGMVVVGGLIGLSGLWVGWSRELGWWLGYWFSGLLVWLVARNTEINWLRVVIWVGVGLSGLGWWFDKDREMAMLSLVRWATPKHHHLADWWAVGLMASWGEVSWVERLVAIGFGGWWLVKGLSRSAVASLLVGLSWLKKNKWWRVGLVGVLLGIGWWISREKDLLSHRVYFVEAIWGIGEKPWGWGMNRFIEVSQKYKLSLGGCGSCVSSYTHSLVLELMVGAGVWVGLLWLGVVGKEIWKRTGVVTAMLVVITVNMLIDYTYAIPAMWWLFWGLLGRIERR